VPKWEHTETGALRLRPPEGVSPLHQGSRAATQTTDDPVPPKP
jgi:hypothetical protein